MAESTKTPKTAPVVEAPVVKRAKLLHHVYDAVVATDPGGEHPVFAEVVTFGTRADAIEYALPRKWDVVSGLPGVPLSELIAAAS